ncbi:T9SS type A sorting domain-containing protein [Dyadobacter sp. CY345]|uniref:T9SS type A sorting domain-containing protein n=1 Tax=Dyadobacter sp. CY345 TaxID=2909335 RepID=UPI001F42D9BB|nr:T9SS type A sorting domain-containing protein [Dyadobacter sp. CY345]MCF2447178.1 T9SS type A sorting domain-containing protein [Dyadobacter sp. CY345]
MKIKLYNPFLVRICISLSLILSANDQLIAQRFNSVLFSKLPQNYQLYPRDSQSEGTVPISGIVEATGYSYVSVQVFRNDMLIKNLKATLKYDNKGVGSFSTETKIKAELAQYSFKVFACKTTDSTLIVTRENVVSGDVFVIDGQSNSTGFFTEEATDPYCRTFGKITDILNTTPYNPVDTLWALSNQDKYFTGVGTMGFEIQKQLSQKYGIPNCLINGGFHWSSSVNHAQRTENNPADLNTGYGRMLYRIQKAGLQDAVKSFIYRQGESEAYHEGSDWAGNFSKMRSNLKLDYPKLEKIYVFQIDIIYFPSTTGAELREYQRKLPEIYPDVRSLATVGTKQFDGLHYGSEGYRQNGMEVSRLIAKDFYQLKDTVNINSPSLKKVFYASQEKKQLILVFDEGQQMVYPEPYKVNNQVTLQMKDFIYLNGFSAGITTAQADGNRIILNFDNPQNAQIIDYLPPFTLESNYFYPYNGPYLTNRLGMRAFTVYQFPIANSLNSVNLASSVNPFGNAVLSWSEVAGATNYVLERKRAFEENYVSIVNLSSAARSYEDKTNGWSGKISYRLKAANDISESSTYGYSEVEIPIVLGTEKEDKNSFEIFPNPATNNERVSVRFTSPKKGVILLINAFGQVLRKHAVNHQTIVTLDIHDLPSGNYLIRLQTENKLITKMISIVD